jgi:hypothetical protein
MQLIGRKAACALTGMALCSLLIGGCSGDQGKKEEKKQVTTQEQMGKDAAQALQKPMDEARKTAAQVEAKADQAMKEASEGIKKAAQDAGVTPGPAGGKEKKKLEGC